MVTARAVKVGAARGNERIYCHTEQAKTVEKPVFRQKGYRADAFFKVMVTGNEFLKPL